MRKRLLLLFAVLAMAINASAYDFKVDGIYYSILSPQNLTCGVTYKSSNGNSYSGDIVIPSSVTYSGKTSSVTSIRDDAFYDCSSLTSVTIPNSVTHIGSWAFYRCSGLTSLTIGTGVVSVGSYAFGGCSSLYKLILLPNTVPTGLSYALEYLSGRVTYVANDNYSASVYGTIKKYDYLSSYFDVDGIRYVPISPSERTCAAITCTYSEETNAIKMNNTVTYKGIEMKVKAAGKHLLRNNRYVESIEVSLPIDIPDNFACGCSNAKSVVMNGVNSVGNYAFNSCTQLNSVVMNGVNSIGSEAFYSCKQLNSVVLNDEISSIGSSAFAYCKSMKSITIPAGVTVINDETFYACM